MTLASYRWTCVLRVRVGPRSPPCLRLYFATISLQDSPSGRDPRNQDYRNVINMRYNKKWV